MIIRSENSLDNYAAENDAAMVLKISTHKKFKCQFKILAEIAAGQFYETQNEKCWYGNNNIYNT